MKLSRSNKGFIVFLAWTACFLLLDWFLNAPFWHYIGINHIFTFIMCVMLICWAISVNIRIIMVQTKRCLILISVFLMLLFILRACRWNFFENDPLAERYLWYMYYIPFVAVPALSFHAAVRTGTDPASPLDLSVKIMWAVAAIILTACLTNDLHGCLLDFHADGSYDHGVVYYVLVTFAVCLTLSSLVILARKCQLSLCRRQMYIPAILCGIGFVMLIIYNVCDGAPIISGIKLFNIQEVYVLIFLGFWEGCIIIGLLPSNTDYGALFHLSHLSARLITNDGKVRFTSANSIGSPDTISNKYIVRRSQPITGGRITWNEDLSTIILLNKELADTNARIEEENDLIEEETRIQAEYTKYETLNRLYDLIADHCRDQAEKLERVLSDGYDFEDNIVEYLLLGTYVKRSANLMLLGSSGLLLPIEELCLAVHESFECMSMTGSDCVLKKANGKKAPSDLVISAYDLFEAVAEAVCGRCSVISVTAAPNSRTLIAIDTDTELSLEDIPEKLRSGGLDITLNVTDGETHIALGGDVIG